MTRIVFLAAYGIVFGAAILFHVAGVLWRRTMSFGEFLDPLLRKPLARWLFVLAWLWLGWHLFVRVDR